MKWAITICGIVLAWSGMIGSIEARDGVQAGSLVTDERPISFLVKEGYHSPVLPLFEVEDSWPGALSFEVVRGPGVFTANQAQRNSARARGGELELPSINPGPPFHESLVQLTDGSRTVLKGLRFVALSTELFSLLEQQVTPDTPGVLFKDATLIVVDEDDWLANPPHLDYPADFAIEAPGPHDFAIRSVAAMEPVPDGEGDQLPDYPGGGDYDGEPDRCPSYGCFANPLPPGVVEWMVADPVAHGFSVKPENLSNALACPQLPKQGIDGVYKKSWGCRKALKVPDNCEANLGATSGNCCCGVLTPLGYICAFIDPTDNTSFPDWPDCYGICVTAP